MKDYSYYKAADALIPVRPNRPPYLKSDATPQQIRKHADEVENYNALHAEYTSLMVEYKALKSVRLNQFYKDVQADNGVDDAVHEIIHDQIMLEGYVGLDDYKCQYDALEEFVEKIKKMWK